MRLHLSAARLTQRYLEAVKTCLATEAVERNAAKDCYLTELEARSELVSMDRFAERQSSEVPQSYTDILLAQADNAPQTLHSSSESATRAETVSHPQASLSQAVQVPFGLIE